MTMGTTGSARQDELRAIETELAGHATFGDARRILDRRRALALLRLETAFRDRPPVRALCKQLRDGRHRRAAAEVLVDPVVLADLEGPPEALRRGDDDRGAEIEEICAAVQRRLRDGASGLPTAAGCLLSVHPRGASSAITLWDPDAPASIFKRRFESAFDAWVATHSPVSLRRPDPAFADAVERGCDLLARVLPELAASALAHLRLIGVVSSATLRSGVCHFIASTAFVRPTPSPWKMAETLLHEALHCKLGHLARTRAVFQWGDGSTTIRPVWRRSQPGADWSLRRAFSAFHVYVHLALFFARVEHLETPSAGAFGAMPAAFRHGRRTALERADHLRRALSAAGLPVSSDCRSMFAWLSQTLQRLSAAA